MQAKLMEMAKALDNGEAFSCDEVCALFIELVDRTCTGDEGYADMFRVAEFLQTLRARWQADEAFEIVFDRMKSAAIF